MILNKYFSIIRLLIYSIIFLLLILIPLEIVEYKSICLIYNIFNIKCLGCGLTRAFFNMVHLNIKTAIDYNALILFFFPLMAIVVLNDCFIIIFRFIKKETYLSKVKISLLEKAIIYYYKVHIIK